MNERKNEQMKECDSGGRQLKEAQDMVSHETPYL